MGEEGPAEARDFSGGVAVLVLIFEALRREGFWDECASREHAVDGSPWDLAGDGRGCCVRGHDGSCSGFTRGRKGNSNV